MAGKRIGKQQQPQGDSPEKRQEVKRRELIEIQAAIQTRSFSGPLPPPDTIAEYNQSIPNGAERIMAMAERQSAHREQLEDQVVRGNIASQTRGSYFAFVLALVALLGGFFLIYTGKSAAAGLVAIISSVGSLAAAFAYSKYEQRNERESKSANLQSRRSRG